MEFGIFLSVVAAMISTFIGIGIAESSWLKNKVRYRFLRYLIGLLIAVILFCPFYFGL